MTQQELRSALEKRRDDSGTNFVNRGAQEIFNALEKAGIDYSDEAMCLLMDDSFKAGADSLIPLVIRLAEALKAVNPDDCFIYDDGSEDAEEKVREALAELEKFVSGTK